MEAELVKPQNHRRTKYIVSQLGQCQNKANGNFF